MVTVKASMGKRQDKNQIKINPMLLCVLFAITIGCNVFTVLCIAQAPIALLQENAVLFSILSCILFVVLCGATIWLMLAGKEAWSKAFLSTLVFLLFCLALMFVLIHTGFFSIIRDSESLKNYLATTGTWMSWLYIVLQYLQVVILPIPSIVSTAAGVALFGPFRTMIYSLIGIVLGSITAFLIGRKFGNKAVIWMVGRETLTRWQKKLKGKDNLFLTVMFLLPLFPDDVLCLIAGLSSMSFGYFTVMIIVSRIIAVATTCYSVELFPLNTWWGISLWIAFFIVFMLVFLYIYKHMDELQEKLSKRFKSFRKKDDK